MLAIISEALPNVLTWNVVLVFVLSIWLPMLEGVAAPGGMVPCRFKRSGRHLDRSAGFLSCRVIAYVSPTVMPPTFDFTTSK